MRLFESSVTPTSAPSAPGAERAARQRGGAAGSGSGLPEVGPCWYRLFRWSWARAEPGPAHVAFRAWSRPPRPSAGATASPAGAMAAAAGDGSVKPLQCAMKLANGAIELDTGNRPRVRRAEQSGAGAVADQRPAWWAWARAGPRGGRLQASLKTPGCRLRLGP